MGAKSLLYKSESIVAQQIFKRIDNATGLTHECQKEDDGTDIYESEYNNNLNVASQ